MHFAPQSGASQLVGEDFSCGEHPLSATDLEYRSIGLSDPSTCVLSSMFKRSFESFNLTAMPSRGLPDEPCSSLVLIAMMCIHCMPHKPLRCAVCCWSLFMSLPWGRNVYKQQQHTAADCAIASPALPAAPRTARGVGSHHLTAAVQMCTFPASPTAMLGEQVGFCRLQSA